MRVAVVGAGAIGTWLGAALAHAGHDVSLIARGDRLEAMRSGGVHVRTPAGEYRVRPAVTADARDVGPVDAVLLAVKAHDQAATAGAVAPLLGAQTSIVAAQNGIPWWYFHALRGPHEGRRVEAVDPGGTVSSALPADRAIGLVVYLGARIVAPVTVEGRVESDLILGEPDGSPSPRLEAIAAALVDAGFPVRRTADIRIELWTKLMGNASFNPISMLTRAGLGTMARDPGVRAVGAQVMQEIVAVAGALGAAPSISIEDRLAGAAKLGEHKTSTLQDLEAGRRVELSALTAAVVELADLTGVPAPVLRTVHALAALEARELGLA